MKDQLIQIKQFAKDHPVATAGVVGFTVGAALVKWRTRGMINITPDQLLLKMGPNAQGWLIEGKSLYFDIPGLPLILHSVSEETMTEVGKDLGAAVVRQTV